MLPCRSTKRAISARTWIWNLRLQSSPRTWRGCKQGKLDYNKIFIHKKKSSFKRNNVDILAIKYSCLFTWTWNILFPAYFTSWVTVLCTIESKLPSHVWNKTLLVNRITMFYIVMLLPASVFSLRGVFAICVVSSMNHKAHSHRLARNYVGK